MSKLNKKLTKKEIRRKEKKRLKKGFKEKLEKWKEDVILRDICECQKCGRNLTNQQKHPHHIISFQSIKRKYPLLLEDLNNGILLCAYCHKWAPDSPHQGGFEFSLWLKINKPKQYEYLKNKIANDGVEPSTQPYEGCMILFHQFAN